LAKFKTVRTLDDLTRIIEDTDEGCRRVEELASEACNPVECFDHSFAHKTGAPQGLEAMWRGQLRTVARKHTCLH